MHSEFEMSMMGELTIFPRSTNQAMQEWNLHQPIKIRQGYVKEVWF